MFFAVSLFTVILQVLLIEYGGEFMKTSPINIQLWLDSIFLGVFTIPLGVLTRFLCPISEHPDCYFDNGQGDKEEEGRLRSSSGVLTYSSSGKYTASDNSDLSELDKSPGKGEGYRTKQAMEISPSKVMPL